MQSPGITALIFDMDGLLVDSEDLAAEALGTFLARHGRDIQQGTMEQTLGRRLPEAISIVAKSYALDGDLETLTSEYEHLRMEAIRGRVTPMLGAREILLWAQTAGLKTALATSSQRSQSMESLTHAGLAGLFDVEVTGESVVRGKPDPQMFLLAAELLGETPSACVVFEDAPAGLQAAAAAGMRVIWVPNARTRGLDPGAAPTHIAGSLVDAQHWVQSEIS